MKAMAKKSAERIFGGISVPIVIWSKEHIARLTEILAERKELIEGAIKKRVDLSVSSIYSHFETQ